MLPMAQKLMQNGVEPVYWSGDKSIGSDIVNAFPDVIFHDQKQALVGIWPEPVASSTGLEYLSESLLEEYADVQRVYMELAMTRAGGGGFQWYELADSFHCALAASLSLVKKLKPDVWISETPPHYMYDYVLFEVCRKHNIKTLMFSRTHLPCRTFVVDEIDFDPSKLIEYANNVKEFEFDEPLKKYVDGVRSSYDKGIPLLIKKNHKFDDFNRYSYSNILSRLKKKAKGIRSKIRPEKIKSLFGIETPNSAAQYLKQNDKKWVDSYVTRFEYLSRRLQDVKKRVRMLHSYHEKITDIDFDKKYIYFPMNLQPECTTVPQAGLYSDQILSLRLLSDSMPDDWRIFIKECPAMFEWHRGSFARHATYYDDLQAIDKVDFVPLATNPFHLIDNSQCVVCSTGTTGWEAILRGKPALMLGDLYWYKGFPGTHRAKSANEMRAFFDKLVASKVQFSQEDVDRYIYAIYQTSYQCTVDERVLAHYDISAESNVDAIAQSIQDALNVN